LNAWVFLVSGALLAAAGQLLLKIGVTGAAHVADYLNARVAAGLGCYLLGTVFWLMALARLPLSRAYPFTILTFVLVYGGSLWILGERMSASLMIGIVLVLLGLVVVMIS
jgi:drug/metabolite transporter (DMT)-like permease